MLLYFKNSAYNKTIFISWGLLQAIQELLPRVDQRFCVRHLYVNFHKQFPEKNLKHLMRMVAYSAYPQVWEKAMMKIKEVN